MVDGILPLNKPVGLTSHDVVARVRKLLHQKRVGHAGTLDPLASGVLPVCVGQATRVAEFLSESGKAYQAEISFGTVTDTYDAEGEVIRTTDTSSLSLSQIEAALPTFLGEQQQMPPRYSAIKIAGQPAYKRARAGEEVTLIPRPIEIYELEILAWRSSPPQLSLAIACSKGTYIRSLAYDLGEQVGTGAHLAALVRTRSGPFSLAESITLDQLASTVSEGTLTQILRPADSAILHLPALYLDAQTSLRVLHGNAFSPPPSQPLPSSASLVRVYDDSGRFIAIASWDSSLWQPSKVFSSSDL